MPVPIKGRIQVMYIYWHQHIGLDTGNCNLSVEMIKFQLYDSTGQVKEHRDWLMSIDYGSLVMAVWNLKPESSVKIIKMKI